MLTEAGNHVEIFEMASKIAPGAWRQQVNYLVPKLEAAGCSFHLNSRLEQITDNGIYVSGPKKNASGFYPGSMVVLSLGVKPDTSLPKALEGKVANVFVVGDAKKAGYMVDATLAAFEAARNLA